MTTLNETMNYIFLLISVCIIIFEVISLHKMVTDMVPPHPEPEKNFKLRIFAVFVGISIIGIVAALSACIGKSDEILHLSVPICSFSNIGIVVWATNASNILR
jgi:hypothetical protein